ncbi:MAG: hypothetical protein OXH59_01675 [Rhodospirillaceae bacterium]|nr:hypothetical protein [Rhodospirillaceae bacterium]
MTPFPDPLPLDAEARSRPVPAGAPPTVIPADLCDDAVGLIEAGWTRQGARDREDRACNALSPRARRFSLDAAVRRAAYDLGGRQFRDRLDPADTAGAALRALSGHIHAMLRKRIPSEPAGIPVFDEVCDSQEVALAVLQSVRQSLTEYPGLRPGTRTRRRRPGVHAFLVEDDEAAILQRDGHYWRIHGFGAAGRCHAATTLAGVQRYCEMLACAEAENQRRYAIAKRRKIARLLTLDRSPDAWAGILRILETPLDP